MSDLPPEGRFGVTAPEVSDFTVGQNGAPPIQPYDGELVWDPDVRDYVRAVKKPDGSFEFQGSMKTVLQKLADLDRTGVFDNARAFVQNRKIFRLFFDSTFLTVRLDPDLRFDPICRYYAVRKAQAELDGTYVYFSGMKDSGGVLISNMIDLNIVVENGQTVAKPAVGGLINALQDGINVVVEFYDDARHIVTNQVYQTNAVKLQALDMTPDNAIVDMIVVTSRAYDIEGDAFLFKGEVVSNLDIRVYLKYADNTTRDITHEQYVGGRLEIAGLGDISTVNITPDGVEPKTFTATYFMVRSNAGLTPGGTPRGAQINNVDYSISKTVKVYVVEDVYDVIEDIDPAIYIEGDQIANTAQIYMRVFGHYRSGRISDITDIAQITGFNGAGNQIGGPTQIVTVIVPQGHGAGNKVFNFTFDTFKNHNYASINGDTAIKKLITNPSPLNGDPLKFTIAIPGVTDNVTYLKNAFRYTNPLTSDVSEVTEIRVRNVKDSRFLYSSDVPIASTASAIGFGYTVHQGKELTIEEPMLVEFLNVVRNAQNQIVSSFSTGAAIFYVQLTN